MDKPHSNFASHDISSHAPPSGTEEHGKGQASDVLNGKRKESAPETGYLEDSFSDKAIVSSHTLSYGEGQAARLPVSAVVNVTLEDMVPNDAGSHTNAEGDEETVNGIKTSSDQDTSFQPDRETPGI